jgi:hypothetical protein
MRGFDVDQRITARVRQRQRFGIAHLETQGSHARKSLRGQSQVPFADVDTEVARRLIRGRDMGRAAAAPAAHFHDFPAAQVLVAYQPPVELQAVFFRLGGALEIGGQRRIAVVHEREVGRGGRGRVVELACLFAA